MSLLIYIQVTLSSYQSKFMWFYDFLFNCIWIWEITLILDHLNFSWIVFFLSGCSYSALEKAPLIKMAVIFWWQWILSNLGLSYYSVTVTICFSSGPSSSLVGKRKSNRNWMAEQCPCNHIPSCPVFVHSQVLHRWRVLCWKWPLYHSLEQDMLRQYVDYAEDIFGLM